MNGVAQLAGSLCGALLVELWFQDLRLLFAASVIVRLLAAFALAASLPSGASGFPHPVERVAVSSQSFVRFRR